MKKINDLLNHLVNEKGESGVVFFINGKKIDPSNLFKEMTNWGKEVTKDFQEVKEEFKDLGQEFENIGKDFKKELKEILNEEIDVVKNFKDLVKEQEIKFKEEKLQQSFTKTKLNEMQVAKFIEDLRNKIKTKEIEVESAYRYNCDGETSLTYNRKVGSNKEKIHLLISEERNRIVMENVVKKIKKNFEVPLEVNLKYYSMKLFEEIDKLKQIDSDVSDFI